MDDFAALGVRGFLLEKLARRGIVEPTEIQRLVIPLLCRLSVQGPAGPDPAGNAPGPAGKNAAQGLIFRAATGTGKTLAYLLPLVQALLETAPPEKAGPPGAPLLLAAAPTYELCSQIKAEADLLLEGSPLEAALLIGSAAAGRQIEALKRRPALVVGNPGRLLLLAGQGKLKFSRLRFLVFDEGDRLVQDELAEESRNLAALAHRSRPLALSCSATLSAKSRERLTPLLGPSPLLVEAADGEIYRTQIEHWAFYSEGRRKRGLLRSLLHALGGGVKGGGAKGGGGKGGPGKRGLKALIFNGRSGEAGRIAAELQFHGIAAAALHGDLDRKRRKQALDDFRAGRVWALVSSDLAARGLDIPGISHVIALDTPQEGEAYLHRAGRTGRAGKRGVMVTIGDGGELFRLAAIEKKLGLVVYPKALYGGRIMAADAELEDNGD